MTSEQRHYVKPSVAKRLKKAEALRRKRADARRADRRQGKGRGK